MIIALLVYICIWETCYGPYPYCKEKVELTYLGTATGECPYFKDENGNRDPEQWKENLYTVAAKAIFASKEAWRHLVKNAALTSILILLSGKGIVIHVHTGTRLKH